jgi:hypothetical protein
MSRFVTIKTNRLISHIAQNHGCRTLIRRIVVLWYIVVINVLRTITISTAYCVVRVTSTKIVVSSKILILEYTVFVCHERLVSTFSKKQHVIKSRWSVHEYFLSYMGF